MRFSTEIKDYIMITIGLCCYAIGWDGFFIPYQITEGGVVGIGAIVYFATGIPMQSVYLAINVVLMLIALKILGIKFCIKTGYGVGALTFLLWFFSKVFDPNMQLLGAGQDFMACIVGAALCGLGLGISFTHNGSTGGTDIVAAVVNKYRDISLGSTILYCDIIIIGSSYFIFHDSRRLIFGYVAMLITSYILDYVVNRNHQSVQFLIISNSHQEIADQINLKMSRGVTILDGQGWYSKKSVKVMLVMVKRREMVTVLRLVRNIDEDAFISQSNVHGVFGKGFDRIKVK